MADHARGQNEKSDKYLINARWSLGSKKKKLFFVFLIGKDRRLETTPKGEDERRHHSSWGKAIVYSGMLAWVMAGFLALSIASLYIAKTWMGIDLLKGSSPVPYLLEKIRLCHPTALTKKSN